MKSDNVYVGKSKINGLGVFAAKDFNSGDLVMRWNTSKILTDEEVDKLPKNKQDYLNCIDGQNIIMQEPERYVNHSCQPNTMTQNLCDIAIKDIHKGEEITEDYAEGLAPGLEIVCNCQKENCRKIIRHTDVSK